ncbi:MAG: CooT family nickel-binding protein [bacterium]
MCEASAYVVRGGREELVLSDVEIVRPEGGKILLRNIFGEQKVLSARLKEINLIEHRILLELERED